MSYKQDKRVWNKANPERMRLASARWRKANPGKAQAIAREWEKKNPDKFCQGQKNRRLRHRYNLSTELWDALFKAQGSLCLICKNTGPSIKWHTDHDHATGKVRGILCQTCNMGLGCFKDSHALLDAASMYLRDRK